MDTMRLNPHHNTEVRSLSFPIDKSLVAATGSLVNAGTSTSPVTSGTVADAKFISVYAKSEAVSGDARVAYLRLYVAGAGGAGEAVRAFCTVDGVAAAGTVNGIHASLNFGDGSGTATGLGNAARCTLHIPDEAAWTSGTLSAIMAEIYSDGAASDTDGVTELSFIRIVNDGNADGIADVDDDVNLMVITGGAVASGNMVSAETDETKFSHKIRCDVHGSTMYLMACDS